MNPQLLPYHIFPLGDSAVTIEFGNEITETINAHVIARVNQILKNPFPGMIEVLPAYNSLTIFYEIGNVKKTHPGNSTTFETVKQLINTLFQLPVEHKEISQRLLKIPVCYDPGFASDMNKITRTNNISAEEVIQIHTSNIYKVYMLGFLPGFAYMGEVDDKIVMPRKDQPENILAGSVGIAGKQTGIYPLSSPGGWNIIGRTPLKIFDSTKEDPALLKTGDRVQFYIINITEYDKILSAESLQR